MATATLINHANWGNQRVVHYKVTMGTDDETATVGTVLHYINGFSAAPSSLMTTTTRFIPNAGADSTAIAGSLGVYSAASASVFYLTVWGS